MTTMTNKTKEIKTNPVKVGNLLVNSWGWEQTNINFYQVVRVTKSSVFYRPISKTYVSDGDMRMSGKSTPVKDGFTSEKVERKLVRFFEGEIALKAEYGTLRLTAEDKSHYESSYA